MEDPISTTPRLGKAPVFSAEELKNLITTSLEDDKASDIVCIDLQGKTDIADFMVVATGNSTRHVHTLATHIEEKLKQQGIADVLTEGLDQCDWVLVDTFQVLVHLFRPEVREFYHIEKMWQVPSSAEVTLVTEDAEAATV